MNWVVVLIIAFLLIKVAGLIGMKKFLHSWKFRKWAIKKLTFKFSAVPVSFKEKWSYLPDIVLRCWINSNECSFFIKSNGEVNLFRVSMNNVIIHKISHEKEKMIIRKPVNFLILLINFLKGNFLFRKIFNSYQEAGCFLSRLLDEKYEFFIPQNRVDYCMKLD